MAIFVIKLFRMVKKLKISDIRHRDGIQKENYFEIWSLLLDKYVDLLDQIWAQLP